MNDAEETAFREYVGARMEHLRRAAFLLCHDVHTADDLVSTVLGKLYDKWRKVRGADNIEAYTRAMLLNTWLDERRRPWRRRERSTDELPERVVPHEETVDHSGVLGLLRSLPPRKRAVLVLRFYWDLSVEETAETLGISIGTVKSQTARGLELLRAAIDANPGVVR